MKPSVENTVSVVIGNKDMPSKMFLNILLKHVEALAECPISFVATVQDGKLFVRGWSRSVMAACQVAEKPFEFDMAQLGMLGDCVREQRAVVENDYASCRRPTKKGYPEGHIRIERFLSVPIFEDGQVVGALSVANKAVPFANEDADDLSAFAEKAWPVIKTKCV